METPEKGKRPIDRMEEIANQQGKEKKVVFTFFKIPLDGLWKKLFGRRK